MLLLCMLFLYEEEYVEGKWSMGRHSALQLGLLNMHVNFSETELKMDDAPTFLNLRHFRLRRQISQFFRIPFLGFWKPPNIQALSKYQVPLFVCWTELAVLGHVRAKRDPGAHKPAAAQRHSSSSESPLQEHSPCTFVSAKTISKTQVVSFRKVG